MDELYHHGILGMRWGVRRYQKKDGTLTPLGRQHLAERNIRTEENLGEKTIQKGTKMYRTTVNKTDKGSSKSTYVTYLDVDRDLYKDGSIVKSYVGGKAGDPVYEHEFELKTDIRIPSLKTVREIEKKVMNDEQMRIEVAKSWIKAHIMADPWERSEAPEIFSIADKLEKATTDKQRAAIRDTSDEYYYEQAMNIYNAKNWVDTNDSFTIERSLGLAKNTKEAIIKELQKQGYNAMYDNASIGVKSDGSYNRNQEGVEPLIIFDRKSTLRETNVHAVNENEGKAANDNYNEWRRGVNNTLSKFK